MAQEARISQYVTIIVGETPPTVELTPDAAVAASGAPACQVILTFTPAPAAAMVSPLLVSFGGIGPLSVMSAAVVASSAPPCTVIFGEIPPPDAPACTGIKAPSYLDLLQKLLPRGVAWTREKEAVLTRLLQGFSCELSCVDERGDALLAESDPRTTVELLTDWEEAVGLPDPCTPAAIGVSRRRAAVVERLTSLGGASPEYFEAVALALGFEIQVIEFHPFVAGSNAGDALTTDQKPFVAGSNAGDSLTNNTDWAFTWAVLAPIDSVVYFSAGQSSAGDPLAEWGNEILECVLRELAPAHTFLIFQYQRVLKPGPAGATLTAAPVTLA